MTASGLTIQSILLRIAPTSRQVQGNATVAKYTWSSYCEFTGKLPERTDPASQDHMTILQGIAAEARLLGRKG